MQAEIIPSHTWSPLHCHGTQLVLSNEREVYVRDGITYLPIYYCMFYLSDKTASDTDLVIPEIKLV